MSTKLKADLTGKPVLVDLFANESEDTDQWEAGLKKKHSTAAKQAIPVTVSTDEIIEKPVAELFSKEDLEAFAGDMAQAFGQITSSSSSSSSNSSSSSQPLKKEEEKKETDGNSTSNNNNIRSSAAVIVVDHLGEEGEEKTSSKSRTNTNSSSSSSSSPLSLPQTQQQQQQQLQQQVDEVASIMRNNIDQVLKNQENLQNLDAITGDHNTNHTADANAFRKNATTLRQINTARTIKITFVVLTVLAAIAAIVTAVLLGMTSPITIGVAIGAGVLLITTIALMVFLKNRTATFA